MHNSFDTERLGEKLSDDDLIKIVQDKKDLDLVSGAIKELTRRMIPNRLEIYQRLLDDPSVRLTVKETIAFHLGTERLAENQELLLRHLKTRDPSLFAKIVQSLGKIGDKRALKHLEQIEAPNVTVSRSSLEFAKSLLSYRLRLNKNLIALPTNSEILEVTNGIPITSTKVERKEASEAFRQVKEDLPAFTLAEEGATKLSWSSVEMLLVFTDKFHEPELLESLRDKSAIPIVLLKKAHSLGRYFLSEYFFTHPSEDHKEVMVLGIRPSGKLTYAGKMQILQEGFVLQLRSIDSLQLPAIELDGKYEPRQRSFDFSRAVSSTKVEARKMAHTPQKASPNLGLT